MLYDPCGQAALAGYCERIVARNLQRDGWLERGLRCNLPAQVWSEWEIHARDIRLGDMALSEKEDDDVPF
jgi:hypothetical protein